MHLWPKDSLAYLWHTERRAVGPTATLVGQQTKQVEEVSLLLIFALMMFFTNESPAITTVSLRSGWEDARISVAITEIGLLMLSGAVVVFNELGAELFSLGLEFLFFFFFYLLWRFPADTEPICFDFPTASLWLVKIELVLGLVFAGQKKTRCFESCWAGRCYT